MPKLSEAIAQAWREGLHTERMKLVPDAADDELLHYQCDYGWILTNVAPDDPRLEEKLLEQFEAHWSRETRDRIVENLREAERIYGPMDGA